MTDALFSRRSRIARHLPRIALALLPVVGVISHVSGGPGWHGIDRLDTVLQDARMRLTLPRTSDPRIVIVDIDEASLTEVGRWPWPRDRLARLLDELFDRQQVAQVGWGLAFDAPDDSTGLTRLRQLAEQELRGVPAYTQRLRSMQASLDHDGAFARALQQRPVVLGYHFTAAARHQGQLPAPAMPAELLQGRPLGWVEWPGYRANLPQLAAAAPVAGFLNPHTDADGRVRSVPLLALHAGQPYEAFALALYRMALDSPPIEPGLAPAQFPARYHGLSQLRLGDGPDAVTVPVSDGVTARVPFLGPGGPGGGSFRYVSAADLLAARVPAGELQGKRILVGSTAADVGARHATPLGADVPAIEVHASLLSGLLDGRLPVRPDYAAGYGLLVLLGVGLLLALALPVLPVWQGILLGVTVIAAILGLNLWLAVRAGLTLPLAPALVMAVSSFALSMGYGYVTRWRAQRNLARLFGAYVPPELAQQMLDDPQHDAMQATCRHMTVMFCDIRGFTRLSESLEPVALQAMLHRVLGRLTEVIRAHGGTIDKYIGDCVMAFWGAPTAVADPARRAVAAALALSQAVRALNDEHRAQGLPEIDVGIGLNSGAMCVGDMGSPQRRAYTVVGDAVNLAARLQSLSAVYGVTIVAGEVTRREADDFEWLELDKVCVRGRAGAVTVHAPRAPIDAADRLAQEDLRTWAALLKAYRAQDVRSSERLLGSLRSEAVPQALRALYAQRVVAMRERPVDPAWDGVTRVDVA
jgi:adenylate cyclase